MKRQCTAEWIEAEMAKVFTTFPKEEVGRTYPVLLLLMARDFGLENLDPRLQQAVLHIARAMGLEEGMEDARAQALTVEFIEALKPNEEILWAVKQIFDEHYQALTEGDGRFNQLAPTHEKAPRLDDVKPEGSIPGGELLRQVTGRIRS